MKQEFTFANIFHNNRGRQTSFTLAELFSPLFNDKSKIAFTLAEVLITLGIIGIVAAMTLPALINNYQKKVLHTQFLKTISDLNNASKLFEVHEGQTVQNFSRSKTESNASETISRFLKYFKGAGKVTTKVLARSDVDEEVTMAKYAYKKYLGYIPSALNGSEPPNMPCDSSISMSEVGGRIFVMDGDLIGSSVVNKKNPKICVDTNGKKGPNKYGYDWFVFVFNDKGFVEPYIGNNLTYYGPDLDNPSTYCSYTQSVATYTCAYYALSDTSPIDSAKSYWKDFLK